MGVPDEPQGLPPSPGELMFTLTKSTSMRMAFFVALVFSSACALPAEKITGVDEVIEAARSLEMGVAQLFNEPGFEEDNPHKYPMYVEFYGENSKRSQTKEASRNDSRSEMNPEVLLKSLTYDKYDRQVLEEAHAKILMQDIVSGQFEIVNKIFEALRQKKRKDEVTKLGYEKGLHAPKTQGPFPWWDEKENRKKVLEKLQGIPDCPIFKSATFTQWILDEEKDNTSQEDYIAQLFRPRLHGGIGNGM